MLDTQPAPAAQTVIAKNRLGQRRRIAHLPAKRRVVVTKLREMPLGDRLDLSVSPVLLTGSQALVRLVLIRAARDRTAGRDKAGRITGDRGAPPSAVPRV